MKAKVLVLLALLLLLVPPMVEQVQAPDTNSFTVAQSFDRYNASSGQTGSWHYIAISHDVVDENDVVIQSFPTEYVGFSIGSRGDIGFTDEGSYVARLIPVFIGEIGGRWWLVPIRNVDTVTDLGTTTGQDEYGDYVELYYSGNGGFPTYRYDDWYSGFVNLNINRMAIRVSLSDGKARIKADVNITSHSPTDTGFGFIFYPETPSNFRYVELENGNVIDLLEIQPISSTSTILRFWDQQQSNLGAGWNWRDLYELGPNSHFEVLNFGSEYGLLTASYGFGASNRVVVDPELTVTNDASELSIENTWTEGEDTVGFNLSFVKSQALNIDRLFNYYTDKWMFDGDSTYADFGLWGSIYLNGTSRDTVGVTGQTYEVVESSDTRIQIRVSGNHSSTSDLRFTWTITVYAGIPFFIFERNVLNQNSEAVYTVPQWQLWRLHQTDVGWNNSLNDDNDFVPSFFEDEPDGLAFLNDEGVGGVFVAHMYDNYTLDSHVMGTELFDSIEILGHRELTSGGGSIQPSTSWTSTEIYGVHDYSAGVESVIDEWDNEVCDSYASISDVSSGDTFIGRNSQTGAFDFTVVNNDLTFTLTPVDSENNFTALHLEGWASPFYSISDDEVLLTENVDYYAYYDSSASVLDIIFAVPVGSVIEIGTAPPNDDPTIAVFEAPERTGVNQFFFVNYTINDGQGIEDFSNSTLTLNNTIVLDWDNSTNTFTETSDPDEYCTLDSDGSQRVQLNSTAYQLCYRIQLNTVSSWSVTSAIVYDSSEANGTADVADLFVSDVVLLDQIWVSEPSVPAGTVVTVWATAYLAFDEHIVGSGDVLVINGYSFSWNPSLYCFERAVSQSTPETFVFDTITECLESTYDITVGDPNGVSVSVEWYAQDDPGPGSPPPSGDTPGSITPGPGTNIPVTPPVDIKIIGALVIGVVGSFWIVQSKLQSTPNRSRTKSNYPSQKNKNKKKDPKWKKKDAWK